MLTNVGCAKIYGDFKLLFADSEDVFAYQRSLGNLTALVYLNFRDKDVQTSLPSDVESHFEYGLGNYADGNQSLDKFVLRPYEARIYFSIEN